MTPEMIVLKQSSDIISGVSALVPSGPHPENELEDLHARLLELEAQLGDRRDAVARTRADLDAFRIKYRHEVGLLHEELDRLELALAEAELGILTERLGDAAASQPASPTTDRIEAAPRFTTDAIRKLFRDVAKAIHP